MDWRIYNSKENCLKNKKIIFEKMVAFKEIKKIISGGDDKMRPLIKHACYVKDQNFSS